jgi:hypothetical protein
VNLSAGKYDRVEITGPSGVRTLTRDEFEKLPLNERVQALLAKQVKFFKGGKEVAAKEVLSG